jgi:curved DNA-binding protein CbpA
VVPQHHGVQRRHRRWDQIDPEAFALSLGASPGSGHFDIKVLSPLDPWSRSGQAEVNLLRDFKTRKLDRETDFEAELTQEQINRYHLDFERLYYRIERSSSHYQVLGIDRNSSMDDIRAAYQKTVALLQPFLAGAFRSSTLDTMTRARQILRKVSEAFTVVSNISKRIEYDNALFRKATGRIPVDIPESFDAGRFGFEPKQTNHALRHPRLQTTQGSGQRRLGFEHIKAEDLIRPDQGLDPSARFDMTAGGGAGVLELPQPIGSANQNRRRFDRIRLTVMARVTGHDRIKGKWEEIVETLDVSHKGAALRLSTRLRHGSVLLLEMALPPALRSHGFSEPTYRVYAAVRRVGVLEDGYRVIGVEFIGEDAPPGYLERPWSTFKIGSWQGPERRREPRVDRSEVVSIRYLNETMEVIRQEVAVTENLSPGGARVFVKGAPSEVELVRITNLNHSFESLAAVCNRYIGNDGFERICLKFLDNRWVI